MIPLRFQDSLPFVEITIINGQQQLTLKNVLIDTGSSACLLKTDDLLIIGLDMMPTDTVRFVRGIGGGEAVVEKTISGLKVGDVILSPFLVQVGAADYLPDLDGILGMDFLLESNAILDFAKRELRFA